MTLNAPGTEISSRAPAKVPPSAPIVVVGAGLSGLMTAHLLEDAGLEVTLLEARNRIGGRVLGLAAEDGAHRVDLGAAWVWPAINAQLADVLSVLGLRLFEQYGRGAGLVEQDTQTVRRHATGFAQQPPSMRVVGGTAALTDALLARLVRTQVLMGTRVCGLQAGATDPGGVVNIQWERGGQAGTLVATSVVLALPPRLLASAVRWSPELPTELSRRWAEAPTWMASHAKFVALYPRAFWREAGLSGSAVSQVGPLAEVHDASDAEGRQAALFGFVGVPALWRRRMGRKALMDAAVAQLGRLFGVEALTPQAIHLQDWADDAETATPVDEHSASVHPQPISTRLPAPWCDCIHLAGSEFATDFPGYLEGAVVAAEQAVRVLLAGRTATTRRPV